MAAGTIPKNLLTRSLTALGALLVIDVAQRPTGAGTGTRPRLRHAAEHPLHHGRRHRLVNVGAYHRGIMERRTRTSKARQRGRVFNAYYAEASCTAGRANFITGQIRSARA